MLEQFSWWTIGLMAAIAMLAGYFHFYRYSSKAVDVGPNILTSIGIFGTFLGVALGLWQFDTTDIQGSVPKLMDGLKTAFWSSIVGLLAALSLKIRSAVEQTQRQTKDEQGNVRSATVDDLDQSLKYLSEKFSTERNIPEMLAEQSQQQITHIDRIVTTMGTYQKEMADANAKALVSAIENVMKDFNTRINEQYGDNFKRLNESVGMMLEWQNNYRDQLGDLISEQERTSGSMKEASEAFEFMVKHANAFNGISESLQGLLTGLEKQRTNLQDQLGGLDKLVSSAADGLPMLEERIGALTSGLAGTIEQQHRWAEETFVKNQQNVQQQLTEIVSTNAKQLQLQQQEMQQNLLKLSERVEQQVGELDSAMEEELNKALSSLGMQLSALSEKFVSDYTPLTQKLQKLIQVAENVKESA